MNEGNSDAHIRLVTPSTDVRFEWRGFDGDDCFDDFQLVVTCSSSTQRFEFGACAVFGLRKLLKFFAEPAEITAGLGFRHPDIRYLDIQRTGEDFQLTVRFEGCGLYKEFDVQGPTIEIQNHYR